MPTQPFLNFLAMLVFLALGIATHLGFIAAYHKDRLQANYIYGALAFVVGGTLCWFASKAWLGSWGLYAIIYVVGLLSQKFLDSINKSQTNK